MKVPYNGEGIGDDYIDRDIVYDIYLVDDIRYVESPPEEFKIALISVWVEPMKLRQKPGS